MAYLTLIIRHVKATKENKRNFLSVHVEEYIKKEYYRCDLTLQDIAYAFGVSKTAICNQFKEATGMTIGEYLFQTRMQYAHKMKMWDILVSVLKNITVFRQENIYRKYSAILGNTNV